MAEIIGLNNQEVQQRIKDGKVNHFKATTSRSIGSILRKNLLTLFNFLILTLGILVLITGSYADTLFAIVIIVNSGIGIFIEVKTKINLDKLKFQLVNEQKVIRNGQETTIKATEIVEDDILVISPGDQILVDAQIIQSFDLRIDESSLTGESDLIEKNKNDFLHSGTICVSGQGAAKVLKVGKDSRLNQLMQNAKKFHLAPSELQQSINQILKYISYFIVPIALLLVWSQLRNFDNMSELFETVDGKLQWQSLILVVTAAIIALIPEGLVLLTSLNFAWSSLLLSEENVLVQQMQAVETLARVNVLCLDKTGTVTTGKSMVSEIQIIDEDLSEDKQKDILVALLTLVDQPGSNHTAQSIEEHLRLLGLKPVPFKHFSPFDSNKKKSAVQIQNDLYELGASEFILDETQLEILKPHIAQKVDDIVKLRYLVFTKNSKLEAIIYLAEQIRPDAKETIEYLKEQNIKPVIISGDDEEHVRYIARLVGINDFHGRVKPEEKVDLIKSYQKNKKVVAMIGDGFNDVLALKQADLGICPKNATPTTKSISEVVLMDSKFSKLPDILAQGRRVMANMERVSNLFLTKTFYSLILSLSTVIFALDFAFIPRQLTLISAFTIGLPSFLMSLPKNNQIYQPGFLKRVLKFSIPAGVLSGIIIFATYFITLTYFPSVNPQFTTVIATLICAFIVLAITARPLNSWRGFLVLGLIIVTAVVFFNPTISQFFDVTFR